MMRRPRLQKGELSVFVGGIQVDFSRHAQYSCKCIFTTASTQGEQGLLLAAIYGGMTI